MKLKKSAKRILLIIAVLVVAILGIFLYKKFTTKEEVKEVKIVSKIDGYGYKLKENKPKKYKEMFAELKKILESDKVDEEAYVKKISEMFIYDFYSLSDKAAKTDVGGVDFVYSKITENFLQNAENSYYKYVESNVYNNRNQSLPIVGEIKIENISQEEYAYNEETDEKAYKVKVTWTYTDENFADYQNSAELIFIHDDVKLSLVELQ